MILAHISGKIRKNYIKILVGDRVTCEISPCACASNPRARRQRAGLTFLATRLSRPGPRPRRDRRRHLTRVHPPFIAGTTCPRGASPSGIRTETFSPRLSWCRPSFCIACVSRRLGEGLGRVCCSSLCCTVQSPPTQTYMYYTKAFGRLCSRAAS